MSFRPNPFHTTYILNAYNMSYIYLNKLLFKTNNVSVLDLLGTFTKYMSSFQMGASRVLIAWTSLYDIS